MLQFTYKLKLAERVKAKCSRHPRYNPEKDGRAGIRGGCSCCFSLYDLQQARVALDAAQRGIRAPSRAMGMATGTAPERRVATVTEEPPLTKPRLGERKKGCSRRPASALSHSWKTSVFRMYCLIPNFWLLSNLLDRIDSPRPTQCLCLFTVVELWKFLLQPFHGRTPFRSGRLAHCILVSE